MVPDKTRFKIRISDLWRIEGRIGRAGYLFWGLTLFSLKYFIDGLVSQLLFHRHWSAINYLVPGQATDILTLSQADKIFFATLLVTALPFIWAGVVLTLKRLRAANLPFWLVKLFFLPFINFLFFVVLTLYPNQEEAVLARSNDSGVTQAGREGTSAAQQKKESDFGQLAQAMLTPLPLAVLLVFFGASVLKSYGWGLFVGIPFAIGMSAAYLYGQSAPRTYGQCLAAAFGSLTLLGAGVFLLAWEGIVCLVMAAPIAYILAAIGAVLGYQMQKRKLRPIEDRWMVIVLLLLFPALMAFEWKAACPAPTIAVTTALLVDEPPEKVWKYVISFPTLPEPNELLFKLGIAYPVGATIEGHGPGALRKCQFSTGAFLEPIKIWDEPRLLAFGVQSQPPSMQERGLLKEIHPAHLTGYLKVENGQFRLIPISRTDGRPATLLQGTTCYQNQMWPNCYWRLWTDYIIHQIHLRVLRQISTLVAEPK